MYFYAVLNLTAQVGINTSSPNATFEVTSSPNDQNFIDGIILPKLSGEELKAKDHLYGDQQAGTVIYVTSPVVIESPKTVNLVKSGYYYFDGSIWQKIKDSSHKTVVEAENAITVANDRLKLGGTLTEPTTINTSEINTLKLTGLKKNNSESSQVLMADTNGVVHLADRSAQEQNFINTNSLPSPAIFQLRGNMNNFLSNAQAGEVRRLNLVEVKNSIQGLTYDASTSTVTFPSGTYYINFVYEATHNSPNCTISSYFMEFPVNRAGVRRVHSTAAHNQGNNSNHGGVMSFTTSLTTSRTWRFTMGRGISGTCAGSGMVLMGGSTQMLIFRLGD